MINIPIHPPAAWFDKPDNIPTDRRLTIEPDGRAYGYIALWNQCHAGASGCVRPPKGSPTAYEYAHQGFTLTEDGSQIRTGVIAGGTVHAAMNATNLQVPEHYENTGNQMMRVRYGEDENGIYFAGALWPDLDALLIEKLRASSISGDWRFSAGWRESQSNQYDFAGACLVNIPGFPTPTTDGAIHLQAGQAYSIVASATHSPIEIIMIDDIYTTFDENYICEDDKEHIVADASTDDSTASQPEPEAQVSTGELDVEMAINMKLENIMTRLGSLESMISQAEAERLLQQVIQNREV